MTEMTDSPSVVADSPSAPTRLAFRWAGQSVIGLVRKNNQDSAYASPQMLIVADGMGGAAAGDLASAVVIKEITRINETYQGEEMLQAFSRAIDRASDSIAELIEADPELDGMGSTATGVMLDADSYALVNIGDSRTYLYRDGELTRLSHDHSFVQTLVDEGRISEEESLIHPHRSLILRVISGLPQHTPDLELVPANVGDRILVCSDGLCGALPDAVIAANLAGEPTEVLERLLRLVEQTGAQDNISIIVGDVTDEPVDAAAEVFGAASRIDVESQSEITGELPSVELEAPRPDPGAAERMRYSPTMKYRLRTWVKVLLGFAVALGLIAGVLGFWYGYTQQQYYLGVEGEEVAIFKGIPDPVFNLPLSSLAESTGIKLADLPRYQREQVGQASYQGSLESLQRTVNELRSRAAACVYARQNPIVVPPSTPAVPTPGAGTATPSGSASPATSGPSPVVSSVPGTSTSPNVAGSVDPMTVCD